MGLCKPWPLSLTWSDKYEGSGGLNLKSASGARETLSQKTLEASKTKPHREGCRGMADFGIANLKSVKGCLLTWPGSKSQEGEGALSHQHSREH